jgi:pseudaminic acid synthase
MAFVPIMTPIQKWQKLWSGKACPPYIIAELSGNHQGSFTQAKALVEAAASAGADAVKLQTYTADTMTLPVWEQEFLIEDSTSLWAGRSLYDLYTEAATPWEWHGPLFDYAKSLGMMAFSSPFDSTAVEFLESLDVPCFKIASFEITDLPLIRCAASKKRPIIISTGMASLAEIEVAVSTARQHGASGVALLKCTSRYPANPQHTHLRAMPVMQQLFNCPVGFSDHTLGSACAVASVVMGGVIVEKHLVLDSASGAIDAGFSANPRVFAELVKQSREAWLSLGGVVFGGNTDDTGEKRYRRSIYIAKDVVPGETLNEHSVRIIRPGFGLAPKHYDAVLGRKMKHAARAGTPLRWSDLSD